MPLSHNGSTIFGEVQAPVYAPPALQTKRVKYWGVVGESETRGQRGGRMISIRLLYHNQHSTVATIQAALKALNDRVGEFGDLVLTGAGARTFRHCTFEGFQIEVGPLPGPVFGADPPDSGWFAIGTLTFYQLRDE